MKKVVLLITILFVSVISTACINNLAVQELNNKAKEYMANGETEKAIPLLNLLIAESENYIDWAFSLGDDRTGMVQRDCLYRFWQWNQCNELLKSMDKERYKQSNQQFEKKYMRFTQLMNYHN